MVRSESIQARRWLATSLLLALVLVFIGTFLLDAASFWVQLIRSGAEAGIIGGLVDWFAVVAIFRHPLGIPFPHTAVIRKSRDRFAEGIDDFITENFSDAETASEYVREKRPGRKLSEWLTQTRNAEFAAKIVVKSVPALLTPKRDPRIRNLLTRTILGELKEQDVLPTLGQILDHLYRHERHQEVIDALIAFARKYIERHPGLLRKEVSEKTGWLCPGAIDRRIAENVEHALLARLRQLIDRTHPDRCEIDRRINALIVELQQGRLHAETVKRWWTTFVTSEQTRRLIGRLWDAIKVELFGQSEMDTRKIEARLAHGLRSMGEHLRADTELQEEIDDRLSDLAGRISPAVVDVAAEYLRDAVKDWSGDQVADKLEAAVGKELQYIRFNGTILGCALGLLLFLIVEQAL